MKGVGEGHDGLTPCGLAGELHGRLHTVRPCRPGKLNFVIQLPRRENLIVKTVQEAVFRDRMKIQRCGDSVLLDIVEGGRLQSRMVVPIVDRSAGGHEIDIRPPLAVDDHRTVSRFDQCRKPSPVRADLGLVALEEGDVSSES